MDTPGTNGALNSALAAEIRYERAAQDITTRDLAERTGIDHRTMLRYLKDQRPISVDRLARFADALGMRPDELIVRAQSRVSRPVARPTDGAAHVDEHQVS